jgi:hypothetical protein
MQGLRLLCLVLLLQEVSLQLLHLQGLRVEQRGLC